MKLPRWLHRLVSVALVDEGLPEVLRVVLPEHLGAVRFEQEPCPTHRQRLGVEYLASRAPTDLAAFVFPSSCWETIVMA